MPTQLTIPVRPGFGVGAFEPVNAFHGLAGLRWSWSSSFGLLLPTFDEAFTALPGPGIIGVVAPPQAPANLFSAGSALTLKNIGQSMTGTQHAAASHYVQRAFALDGVGTAVERVANDIHTTNKVVVRKLKPTVIYKTIRPRIVANLRPLRSAVATLRATNRREDRQIAKLQARIHALERERAADKAHAVTAPLPVPGGIRSPITWPKIKPGRLTKWLGLAALLASMAKVLEKMGVNHIRCRNSKRWGDHICGLDPSILENLILDTFLIIGSIDLREFAEGMQTIVGDVAYGAVAFWDKHDPVLQVWDDLMSGGVPVPGP